MKSSIMKYLIALFVIISCHSVAVEENPFTGGYGVDGLTYPTEDTGYRLKIAGVELTGNTDASAINLAADTQPSRFDQVLLPPSETKGRKTASMAATLWLFGSITLGLLLISLRKSNLGGSY